MSKKNPVKLVSLYLSKTFYDKLVELKKLKNEKSINSLIIKILENDYNNFCIQIGTVTLQGADNRVSLYCPVELYRWLEAIAKKFDRSVCYTIKFLLEYHIKHL